MEKQNSKIDLLSIEFANAIRKELKEHIKKIVLFGSRARGDFRPDSDYDVLIILDQNNKTVKDKILDVSSEFMMNYFLMFSFLSCDQNEWEIKKKYPIGKSILREGIEL